MSQTNGDNSRSKSILQNASNGNLALLLGGAALAIYGVTRRSKTGMALAAAGGILAISKTYSQAHPTQYTAKSTFTIETTPETAYQFWKDFENLPRFMRHLKSVRITGPRESEWVALGPLEQEIRWRAETTEDTENRRIAWRSLPGSQVANSGSVEFTPGKDGRGTWVTVELTYLPPAGAVGKAAATLLGKDPEFTVREDLRRFKALIEAGECPTTLGQPHGPRGLHGSVEQVLFREVQNLPSPPMQAPERRTA